jgi:hypothetical protein
MLVRRFSVLAALLFLVSCSGSPASPSAVTTSPPAASGGSSGTGTTTSTTPLSYVQDIAPILNSDCTRCHSGSRPDGGVLLTSYPNVLRYVQPGSASSLLVRVTQPGGLMYSNLTGDRATKAARIRAWVVDNSAIETR